ncbi:MAG: ubiquitin-like small modifier protein 1 [Candidatus Odinarchaeota archaeon]
MDSSRATGHGKIRVTVRVFANFREITNKKIFDVTIKEGTTIRQLLDVICEMYSLRELLFNEKSVLLPHNQILINGRNMKFLEGLQTKLADNDEIALFPPAAGGLYLSTPENNSK